MNPFLQTTRLYFERLDQGHLPELFKLHSDPEVMRYIRAPDLTIEETQKMVDRFLKYAARHASLGLFVAFLKTNKLFIGWGILHHLEDKDENEIEVGYRLHQNAWGKGYATEIADSLAQYGFKTLGLQRIVGITHPENLASQRVLRKIGLVYEKDAFYHNLNVKYFAKNRAS